MAGKEPIVYAGCTIDITARRPIHLIIETWEGEFKATHHMTPKAALDLSEYLRESAEKVIAARKGK